MIGERAAVKAASRLRMTAPFRGGITCFGGALSGADRHSPLNVLQDGIPAHFAPRSGIDAPSPINAGLQKANLAVFPLTQPLDDPEWRFWGFPGAKGPADLRATDICCCHGDTEPETPILIDALHWLRMQGIVVLYRNLYVYRDLTVASQFGMASDALSAGVRHPCGEYQTPDV